VQYEKDAQLLDIEAHQNQAKRPLST